MGAAFTQLHDVSCSLQRHAMSYEHTHTHTHTYTHNAVMVFCHRRSEFTNIPIFPVLIVLFAFGHIWVRTVFLKGFYCFISLTPSLNENQLLRWIRWNILPRNSIALANCGRPAVYWSWLYFMKFLYFYRQTKMDEKKWLQKQEVLCITWRMLETRSTEI